MSLLLNYFSGLDLERRDHRGLTAPMKAAIQDRAECVATLLMAGGYNTGLPCWDSGFESNLSQSSCCRLSTPSQITARCPTPPHSVPCQGADLTSVDPVRGKTALEWALLTDSFNVVRRIRQLLRRPCAEQLCQHYQLEWPALPGLVAQAQARDTPSFLERLQATLNLSFARCPQEGGVLDHLVAVTTSLASPFLATACHTLCPDHPPKLGTQGKSVPELLSTTPPPPLSPQPPQVVLGSQVFVSYNPQGMFSQRLQPKNHTRSLVPKILLSKAPSSPSQSKLMMPRCERHQSLALPLWRYQELRMKRKQQEEELRRAQN